MLEYPEARVVARQMAEVLTGRRVESVETGKKPHKFTWFTGDAHILTGRVVDGAEAFGGMPVLKVQGACLAFSDGASPVYYAPETKKPDQHQLLITFDDASALAVRVAMYGGMYAGEGDPDNEYYKAAKRKSDPLTDAFGRDGFEALFDGVPERASLKALLATQQRVPGLGNGVLQDILLNASLHPKRISSTLSRAEMDHLCEALVSTLREMTRLGGRDTEHDFFGNEGGYRTMLSRKNAAMLCPKCGGPVRKQAYLGGSIYFCRNCQGD